MSKLSSAKVLQYLNKARTDPKSLIPHLEKVLSSFKDQTRYEITPNFYMVTHEGRSAWKETIQYLKSQKPLPQFSTHKGLEKSSQYHAADLGKNNMMGHVGSNGSTMGQRIKLFSVHNGGYIGENVAQQIKTGSRNHEFEAVLSLIIDDGVPDRGHRQSIFSQHFRYAGIGFGQTNKHFIIVINYADNNLPLKEGGNQKVEEAPTQPKTKVPMTQFDDLTNILSKKMAISPNQKSQKSTKTVVSKNTTMKSKTSNGKTVTIKTVHMVYSDGSEQTNISETHT